MNLISLFYQIKKVINEYVISFVKQTIPCSMKKLLLILSILSLFIDSYAQKTNNLYISSGTSFAGSGDVRGFYIGSGIHFNKKRINLYYELATSLHDSKYIIFYDYFGNKEMEPFIQQQQAFNFPQSFLIVY